jgi:hypothetical protein
MRISYFVIAVLFLVGVSSCKKTNSNNPVAPVNTIILNYGGITDTFNAPNQGNPFAIITIRNYTLELEAFDTLYKEGIQIQLISPTKFTIGVYKANTDYLDFSFCQDSTLTNQCYSSDYTSILTITSIDSNSVKGTFTGGLYSSILYPTPPRIPFSGELNLNF